jgi:hypothetical protein
MVAAVFLLSAFPSLLRNAWVSSFQTAGTSRTPVSALKSRRAVRQTRLPRDEHLLVDRLLRICLGDERVLKVGRERQQQPALALELLWQVARLGVEADAIVGREVNALDTFAVRSPISIRHVELHSHLEREVDDRPIADEVAILLPSSIASVFAVLQR